MGNSEGRWEEGSRRKKERGRIRSRKRMRREGGCQINESHRATFGNESFCDTPYGVS